MPNPFRAAKLTDTAGVLGAVFAALCCAGAPFVVSVLASLGLTFLRNDRILLPLMAISLGVALWGFARGRRVHGHAGPLWLAAVGAVGLATGTAVLHGTVAMLAMWTGGAGLLIATAWNVGVRMRCAVAR
jgi:mercuric ion transport protein